MTPQSQRIAIAEACGWKRAQSKGVIIEGWLKDDSWSVHLPDYLSDLNAMHEAERKMTMEQADEYFWLLLKVCNLPDNLAIHQAARMVVFAPAAKRAEAFLKTLGLWKSN